VHQYRLPAKEMRAKNAIDLCLGLFVGLQRSTIHEGLTNFGFQLKDEKKSQKKKIEVQKITTDDFGIAFDCVSRVLSPN